MRETLNLNDSWRFIRDYAWKPGCDWPDTDEQVAIPHCFNIDNPSYRCVCSYRRDVFIEEIYKDKCLFLEFQGVNSVCNAYLNGVYLGEHRGGYSAFRFDITDAYNWGDQNVLIVLADSTHYEDVNPLGGDFSVLGGIYRDVSIICTGKTHFDLMYHGSPGVFLTPCLTEDGNALLKISAGVIQEESCELEIRLKDPHGNIAASKSVLNNFTEITLEVPEPLLWDGLGSPVLYTCVLTLCSNGMESDSTELPVGFRSIEITADKGFCLNGKHLRINGVAKHQDRAGKGNATSVHDLNEDMELIKEIGANAIRLSHYQHPQYFYDLCDKEGMIVWAEIPMLGMTGDAGLMDNAKQQLTELILQNYHHPGICFWGLQNEIAMHGESMSMYQNIEALNTLAKELDSTRFTIAANLYVVKNKSPLNHITDMIGYNVYFGWYYGEMEDYGGFLDNFHMDNSDTPIGISEYGVDCNVTLHSDTPNRKNLSEEFQSVFHETVYPYIASRSFVWGSFVWNMFDFSSAMRVSDKLTGINTKGLVTGDRQTRKDAFYYYKALWSVSPFVHIASRRFVNRHTDNIDVKVYSNMDEVTLTTGSYAKTQRGKAVFLFEQIPLETGVNLITAISGSLKDEVTFRTVDKPDESYIYVDPNPGFNVKNWFDSEESEDDLFPEDCYSLMDSVNDLKAKPEAWELICDMLPEFAADPRVNKGTAISLFRVLNRNSGKLDENVIIKLNRSLNKIRK